MFVLQEHNKGLRQKFCDKMFIFYRNIRLSGRISGINNQPDIRNPAKKVSGPTLISTILQSVFFLKFRAESLKKNSAASVIATCEPIFKVDYNRAIFKWIVAEMRWAEPAYHLLWWQS